MEDEERGTENGEREFRVILVNIQFDGWIGGVNMRSKASFTLSRTKYDWIEKPKVALCGLLYFRSLCFLCYIVFRRC